MDRKSMRREGPDRKKYTATRWAGWMLIVGSIFFATVRADPFIDWVDAPPKVVVMHDGTMERKGLDNEWVRKMKFTAPSGDKYACYLPGKGGKKAVVELEQAWFGKETKNLQGISENQDEETDEMSGSDERRQAPVNEEPQAAESGEAPSVVHRAIEHGKIQDELAGTPSEYATKESEDNGEAISLDSLEQVTKQLDPLHSLRSICFFKPNGYWTFEVCPGNMVRQFHLVTKHRRSPDFSLGTFHHTLLRGGGGNGTAEEIYADALLYLLMNEGIHVPDNDMNFDSLLRIAQREGLSEEDAFDLMNQIPEENHQQLYLGGQICHETYSHRKTIVEYQCGQMQHKPKVTDQNARSKLGIISRIKETSTCQYIVTITTPLACPFSAEGEANAVDQKALDPTPGSALDMLKKAKPQCYTHQGGWWTYETCLFGRFTQFHQDKNKNLVEENLLGKYSPPDPSALAEEKEPGLVQDLDKPERSYLALNYTGGSMCDITGERRTAVLRVTCGDTLFITNIHEVSTCTYTATVQSPALCNHPAFWPKVEEPLKLHCWKETTPGINSGLPEAHREVDLVAPASQQADKAASQLSRDADSQADDVADEDYRQRQGSDFTEL